MSSPNPNAHGSSKLDATGHHLIINAVPEGTPRPLWSVMIPTYNCARYLGQTLESVLSQDPGPEVMQIEVVDDCSTKDDPESVVREVGRGRAVFYRQPQNVGHTRNFETCLQRSRGHLVHLLHGDDAVRPGFYARMGAAFSQHPEIGAAFSRNLYIDGDSNWMAVSALEAPQSGIIPDLVERLAVTQRIQTPAMVVRRQVYETLGAFDRRLSWTEDWEMWTRIATKYPVWHEIEPLALYRSHNTSNSSRYLASGENVRDLKRIFDIIEGYVPNGRGKQLCRQGREYHATLGLQAASKLLAERNLAGAAAQTRASLALCSNWRVLARLTKLAMRAIRGGIAEDSPSAQ